MPKAVKKNILPDIANILQENEEEIKGLCSELEDEKYFICDPMIFDDGYKIANAISGEYSIFRYVPEEETKHMIELITDNNSSMSVIKIPIIKTNITEPFIAKLQHSVNLSQHINLLLIAFNSENKRMTIRTSYKQKYKINVRDKLNTEYFSLNNAIKDKNDDYNNDKDEYQNEEYESADYDSEFEEAEDYVLESEEKPKVVTEEDLIYCFDSIMEKKVLCDNRNNSNMLVKVKDSVIKNPLIYANVDFEYVMKFFKKINGPVNISVVDKNILFKSYNSKQRAEEMKLTVSCDTLSKNHVRDINFIVNSSEFNRLKSLNKKYHILPNIKPFNRIEIKIVLDNINEDGVERFGITIFPGNLTNENNKFKTLDYTFDIYNSVMIYISENQ